MYEDCLIEELEAIYSAGFACECCGDNRWFNTRYEEAE